MARTATRRHKGCALCKPWKDCRMPHAQRAHVAELRFVGRTRRLTRHELGDRLT